MASQSERDRCEDGSERRASPETSKGGQDFERTDFRTTKVT